MSRSNRGGLVYSTDRATMAAAEDAPHEAETLPMGEQRLRVSRERKGRKGKTVTLVSGFVGTSDDLSELAKALKGRCGIGGSVKEGEVILQGDLVDKVVTILKEMGYVGTRS